MTQAPVDHPPLTLAELSELLSRYVGTPAVAMVIKDAMHRRLAERATS